MKIKKVYDNESDVPSELKAFYEERDGKWHLTLYVEGMASQESVTRLERSLNSERADHKTTKEKLRKFEGLDPDETREKLDKLTDLEAGGNLPDEQKVNNEVERRIKSRIAPVERERDRLKTERDEAVTARQDYEGRILKRDIRDELRGVAGQQKIVDTAIDDVLMYGDALFTRNESGETVTKDDVPGVTPGLRPDQWLADQKKNRPHWWPQTQGAGSRGGNGGPGGGGENPFSDQHWNATKQAQLVKENYDTAVNLARQAGTTVGGPRPRKAA